MRNHRCWALGYVLLALFILGAWAAGATDAQSQWTTGGITKSGSPAPKELKGRITRDVYTPRDKSFRVALPHPKDSYEFSYTRIVEGVTEREGVMTTYVTFGPAAFDRCVYHAVAIIPTGEKAQPQSMLLDERAVSQFEGMTGFLQKEHGVAYRQILKKSLTVNGREAVYAVYEREPWEGGTIELQPNVQVLVEGPPPHVALCLIDFGNGRFAYLIGEHQDDLAGMEQGVDLTKGQWPRFDSLIQSIELAP
ncbi:MAG TPA: hypothetical protein VF789_22675 [Thermoanaerobaculia bacterium]